MMVQSCLEHVWLDALFVGALPRTDDDRHKAVDALIAVSSSGGLVRAMMDIEEDIDLDYMAQQEEELMREAELENLQREAEIAFEHRVVEDELRPYFYDGSLADVDGSSVPVTQEAVPNHVESVAATGGSSSSSSGSWFVAVDAPSASGLAVSAAPETPPSRLNLLARARSCTPPKRRREPSLTKGDESEVVAICLPLAADSAGVTNTLPPALSLPPSGGGVPCVKRRRIRGKAGDVTTVPEPRAKVSEMDSGVQLDVEDERFLEYVGDLTWPSEMAWKDMPSRVQRGLAWDKTKNAWCKMRSDSLKATGTCTRKARSGGWQSRWKDARDLFQHVDSERRRVLLNVLLEKTQAPPWVRASIVSVHGALSMHTRKRVQSALYTWVSSQWQLPPAAAKGRLVEVAVSVAKRVGWARDKYDRFVAFVEAAVEQLDRVDWALTAELCTQTLEQEGRALFHFHLLLRHVDSQVWMPGPAAMVFEGIRPNVTAAPNLGGQRGTSARTWAGYFYCTVPKIGQVHVLSNKTAFRDFPVQGQWVMALLQAGKIDAATARELVYKVAHGVTRLLADLDVVQRKREETRVTAARSSAVAGLAARQSLFRVIPEVEAWDAQYQELKERCRFLVLEGRSKVGKTAFARSKCVKGGQVLEINCAAGGEPDLRSYLYGRDGLILCDEIEAVAVAAQRKLFQAGTAFVQLGTSPTNIHVYSVFLHRVRIICASNNWSASLAKLSKDDQDWISENSVYVRCDEALWVQA